ncbi:MAG: efflux RND transporter permease subunit [Methylococcales bacterium]
MSRVNLVGGRAPEFHVVVDPLKMHSADLTLTLTQVTDALNRNNLIVPSGLHEETHLLYLVALNNRSQSPEDIGNLSVSGKGGRPVPIREFAHVLHALEPVFNRVTSFYAPIGIVSGALLALFGSVLALWLTGDSFYPGRRWDT